MPGKHFIYIVRCRNGDLYTGYTTDVARRIETHNRGEGARFTRGRGPVELVYSEEFASKSEAMAREAYIKRLPRIKKLKMIAVSEDAGQH